MMPSTKKRINLTIPDEVYQRLQEYKVRNGFESDATACLQMIVKQLNGDEQMHAMLSLLGKMSVEDASRMFSDGYEVMKQLADKEKK